MNASPPRHGLIQISSGSARVSTKTKPRPKRTKDLLVAGIIILVAVAAAIYTYELNTASNSDPPKTLVHGILTPRSAAQNFTEVFFTSTTTRVTYSAPVTNGTYGTYFFSNMVYNVTIEIQTSNGAQYCLTNPPSIRVAGTSVEGDFDCFYYV